MNYKIKIPYKTKQVRINLILGILWILNGVVQIYLSERNSWPEYFWLFFGVFYLTIYFYQKKRKYISIENGVVKQNWPFGKSIKLSEIKIIRHFSGDFILKSDKKKLTIHINFIDEESLIHLKEVLKSLDVEWKSR